MSQICGDRHSQIQPHRSTNILMQEKAIARPPRTIEKNAISITSKILKQPTTNSQKSDRTMIQAQPKPVTFEEFIAGYPENSEHHYELHRGVIVEMAKPRGKHSEIAGFLAYQLNSAIGDRNAFIPKECLIKPRRGESGYEPDVIVLDLPSNQNPPPTPPKRGEIRNKAVTALL